MGCDTDEVEEILLETEWCGPYCYWSPSELTFTSFIRSVCNMAEAARMSDRVTELLVASV
jgi:hypothetical protein